jgi:hypothetical protein
VPGFPTTPHLFKTVRFEIGKQERMLDAICGHTPRHLGGTFGDVTLKTMAENIGRMPRFAVD